MVDWREVFIKYACFVDREQGTDFLNGNDFVREISTLNVVDRVVVIDTIDEARRRQGEQRWRPRETD